MPDVIPGDPVLSVDTAYDPVLEEVRDNRYDLYDRLENAGRRITRLTFHATIGKTLKERMFEQLRTTSYRSILISTHGSKDELTFKDKLDDRPKVLLSARTRLEDLSAFAGGRSIYLFACKACSTVLHGRLLHEAGANLVIGFTKTVEWETSPVKERWMAIDCEIIECLLDGSGLEPFEEIRLNYMKKATLEEEDPRSPPEVREDYGNMRGVLESMVIRKGPPTTEA